MKYKDNGQWKEIYVKALDSMPVGTEVDFDGQASDIPVGWEQVDDVPVYSTTETVCGTYSRKPLYSKVFSGSYTNGDTILSNIDNIISVKGTALLSGTIKRVMPYFEVYNNQNYSATVRVDGTDAKISLINAGSVTSATCNFALEYTKTTD